MPKRRTGYKRKSSPFIWKNKPEQLTTHFCGYCGEPLEMTHPSKKYCDKYCRRYAEYDRMMERKRKVWEEILCAECGNPFTPHNHKQICCCATCSGDHLRKWQKKWYHANKDRLGLVEKYRIEARVRRAKAKEKRGEVSRVFDMQPSKFYGGKDVCI